MTICVRFQQVMNEMMNFKGKCLITVSKKQYLIPRRYYYLSGGSQQLDPKGIPSGQRVQRSTLVTHPLSGDSLHIMIHICYKLNTFLVHKYESCCYVVKLYVCNHVMCGNYIQIWCELCSLYITKLLIKMQIKTLPKKSILPTGMCIACIKFISNSSTKKSQNHSCIISDC